MKSVQFSFSALRGAPDGEMELKKVNVLIGSEEKGSFKIAQLLAALYLANSCNDIHTSFRKTFGMPAVRAFDGQGEARLGEVSLKIGPEGMCLKRGSLPWSYLYYVPAVRSLLLATLQRLSKLPVYFDIVAASMVEAFPSPVRLFLESMANYDLCGTEPYEVLRKDVRLIEELELNGELVPNLGKLDLRLLEYFSERAKPGSLVVVEEPSIFKTVEETINEVKKFLELAIAKDMTVFIVTSRLASVYAVNDLVDGGKLEAKEIGAYYLKDDTVEPLPVAEKMGVELDKVRFVADLAE